MLGDDCSDCVAGDLSPTPPTQTRWLQTPSISPSGSNSGLPFPNWSDRMYLWAGSKATNGRSEQRSIYHKIYECQVLDKRKTVTALRAGEDRAMLLGLSMLFFSVMMYFVLGITILRSYSDSVWTEETSCTVLNATIVCDVNCSYSCGEECWRSARYPCLHVYVSLNSSGKVVQLLYNEETQDSNPECFYIPKCHKDYTATHAVVQDIADRLRAQHTVPCFVDPNDRVDGAILTQLYGQGAVFHSLFWPTCSLIGGTIIIAMVKLTQHLSIMSDTIKR